MASKSENVASVADDQLQWSLNQCIPEPHLQ